MKKYVLVLMVGLMMVSAANANLLLNGGFELPGVAHGPINESGDWTEFGTVSQRIQIAGWASNEGAAGAWLQGWNNNRDGGFYQDVPVVALQGYGLWADFRVESGFASTGGTGGTGTLDMGLLFLDAADQVVGGVVLDVTTAQAADGSWNRQYIGGTAPVGAVKARAQIAWTTGDQSAVPNPRSAMVDDVVLVPEPATMGLLGFGALALIRRKK